MGLQDQIKKDLATAMKAKDEEKKSILRVIMGEFGRQSQKEIPDGDVVQIIKKLIKSEKEVLAQTGGGQTDRFIEVAEGYLPKMATEADIAAWVKANIDFSKFNNKMQAMKPIMAHFGAAVDGNLVKKVLQGL
ncbi:MAG: GatB/YqeY domain-containing protein [Desulfobacterales bacterium]|nr:GatB/YqeY domain-containing protein [Desulfobacterales bacterium]